MDDNTNTKPEETTPITSVPQAAPEVAPAPQQVVTQYVVSEQSLSGIGGWLIFWLIAFSITGITYLWTFFLMLMAPGGDALRVLGFIFTPLLTVSSFAAVVFIAMQKKRGQLASLVTLGLSALYISLTIIVAYVIAINKTVEPYSYGYRSVRESDASQQLPLVIGGVLVTLIAHALVGLYFILSKRVKHTLIK